MIFWLVCTKTCTIKQVFLLKRGDYFAVNIIPILSHRTDPSISTWSGNIPSRRMMKSMWHLFRFNYRSYHGSIALYLVFWNIVDWAVMSYLSCHNQGLVLCALVFSLAGPSLICWCYLRVQVRSGKVSSKI